MRPLLALLLGINLCYGQRTTIPDELFGFRLGQYRSAVLNELGQPHTTQKSEDSTFTDFYYVSKDSSSYVGFHYLSMQGNPIYTIQLTGKEVERSFYGINLGDNKKKLESAFGKPDTILIQDFNKKQSTAWKYKKLNLSVLLTDDRIESIRIWDEYETKGYNTPTLEDLLAIINTGNKSKIADILSPGLEVYYCGKVITWKNSFQKDIYVETASVMDFITNKNYGIATLSGKEKLIHNDELRFIAGSGTFPVIKFPEDDLITEIVLKYEQGRFKIWEILYKCKK